jgi:hypothetical protein
LFHIATTVSIPWKGLPGKYALAYLTPLSVTKKIVLHWNQGQYFYERPARDKRSCLFDQKSFVRLAPVIVLSPPFSHKFLVEEKTRLAPLFLCPEKFNCYLVCHFAQRPGAMTIVLSVQ